MKMIEESSILYNEAIKLIDLNNYAAAIKSIKKNFYIIKNEDDLALLYLNCGFLNYKLRDYSAAIDNFSNAIYYEAKLNNLNGRSKDISFNGRSNSRYKNEDYHGAIEDKIKGRNISLLECDAISKLNKIQINYKDLLLGSFDKVDLAAKYKILIKTSKQKKNKYDLIEDFKKVINKERKEEVIKKLEVLSKERYRVGDYKGSIKAIIRAEKYY